MFSAGDDGEAVFHPAVDLERENIAELQTKMRHRGLRWLHRHGHLDDDAVHVLDSLDHAGGWSVDASVTILHWDRHGLEHLVTPPRLDKHRTCGMLAPNAALREAVTASAGPAGATLQLLEEARASMGLPSAHTPPAPSPAEPAEPSPLANLRRAAARCWALLCIRGSC